MNICSQLFVLSILSANVCCDIGSFFAVLEFPTTVYGEHLREQVEDRLKLYDSGEAPKKNVDVMKLAIEEVRHRAISHKAMTSVWCNLLGHCVVVYG